MCCKAAVEFRSLGFRKLEDLWSVRDAIPKILNQLNALGHRQMAEI